MLVTRPVCRLVPGDILYSPDYVKSVYWEIRKLELITGRTWNITCTQFLVSMNGEKTKMSSHTLKLEDDDLVTIIIQFPGYGTADE